MKDTKIDLTKIKNIRREKNLSLEKMSHLLGYESLNGYYYLEIGRGKFPAETLYKVAEILEVDINELFFEVDIAKMAK